MDAKDNINIESVECNDKSHLLLESGLVLYLALQLNGIIDECNEAFSQYLGYDQKFLVGKDIETIMPAEEKKKLLKLLKENNLPNRTVFFTSLFISKLGNNVHGMLNGKSFLCTKCNEIKYYFIFTDITEKIEAFDKVTTQLEHLKIKDELIQTKDLELKRQNLELTELNKELKEQVLNSEILNRRIVEHEMRTKQALNAVNDGIWEYSSATGDFNFSDKFFTMLGYDPFEFPQTLDSWLNLLHPDDFKIVKLNVDKIIADITFEIAVECRMRKKEGEYLWVLTRGRVIDINKEGRPSKILGTHVDIDQRKRFELVLKENDEKLLLQNEEYQKINKRLEKSNQNTLKLVKQLQDKQAHLDSIFKTVPATIGLISNRVILFANEYACLMTGYELDEIIGREVSFLCPNEEEYNRVVAALQYESGMGKTRSVNTVWKMKNDTLLDVYLTATHISSDVAPNTYTLTAIDVTSQRMYEEQLIIAKEQAEKAEKLKTVFLCNMSHELRTPANGIIGFAEMLQLQVNPAKRDQYLKIIINSSKQLVKIISDIVDISKIETGDIVIYDVKIDLEALFSEYTNTYRSYLANRGKTHIQLDYKLNVDEKSKFIICDENKLRQILNSLLNNAIKFTDNGKIEFGCSIIDDTIEFYVLDSGIGIDSSEFESIFECFRQTETPVRKLYGGNGLGLAIAKGFVNALGGKIWVESARDSGSVFHFRIPFKQAAKEEVVVEVEEIKNWSYHHILIVEDDITSMSLIDAILEGTSIKVSQAVTGLEAVKACKKDKTIDIVLMDMRLPEMDGYEASMRIKEIRPNLAIIAQTAHALTEDRSKCIRAGCDDYITKPIDQDKLFELLEMFFEKIESSKFISNQAQ